MDKNTDAVESAENPDQKKTKFPKEIKWNEENESILKKWADKGLCFKTMHDRATKKYWCLNAWFAIPVIIISTLTGSGNFAQNSFHPSYKETLILLIAGSNIFAAILSTIAQYIGVAGLYESHKFASLSWDKYSRSIQVELSKNRSERSDASSFISKAQEDFNRLMEISPVFSNDIISWFNHLIDTGNFDESTKYACGPCCYEWFCFPCGCKGCHSPDCSNSSCGPKSNNNLEDSHPKNNTPTDDANTTLKTQKELIDYYMENKQYQEAWRHLELPDILGRMRPTSIADPNSDPGRIVEEDKIIQVEEDKKELVLKISDRP